MVKNLYSTRKNFLEDIGKQIANEQQRSRTIKKSSSDSQIYRPKRRRLHEALTWVEGEALRESKEKIEKLTAVKKGFEKDCNFLHRKIAIQREVVDQTYPRDGEIRFQRVGRPVLREKRSDCCCLQ